MKLNADLGEHEPPARTRALMRLIDLANIACGVHAGSPVTMERCVKLAIDHGVQVGAHPGVAGNFGRGAVEISAAELEEAIVAQASALKAIAGARMRHIKLHGSLYHAVEKSASLARRYVETVRTHFPCCAIVAFAGGRVIECCGELGVECLGEAFAERGYLDDGMLVPRGQAGDVITSPAAVAARTCELLREGCVTAVSGLSVHVGAGTICVHSDNPNAVRIARTVRAVLGPRV
jgi:UPF0271 protein